MDADVLTRLLTALEARGVSYAVFGAVALNLHGLVRATEDLALFVAPEAENISRLKQALRDVVDDPDIESISADDLSGEYPALQYIPPDGSLHIDVITRLGSAFAFADLVRERIPFQGLAVSVVSPRTLYEMKRDTIRPKDRIDAMWLRDRFGLE